MTTAHVLQVFLTVDTEVWPNVPKWPAGRRLPQAHSSLYNRIETDIEGKTSNGNFGIDYQLSVLKRSGLRATYFVEPLASGFFGKDYLCHLISRLIAAGQDVQLHLHTEWLSDLHDTGLPSQFRQFLHEFDEDEQTALIGWGMDTLQSCGVGRVRAFRAGSYGADAATLRALQRNGIFIDSSYNAAYADAACKLRVDSLPLQPWHFNGVLEFPVTVFEDYPGHVRNAQLGACSLSEMTRALDIAWRQGWNQFTIPLHSFECVRNRMGTDSIVQPDRANIRRFEGLCAFLGANHARFKTMVYSDVDVATFRHSKRVDPIKTGMLRTVMRVAEQAWGRVASSR